MASLSLSLPGCAGGSEASMPGPTTNPEDAVAFSKAIVATRLEPRGGGDYPLASSTGCTFADPLIEDTDFEPLVSEEEGGTRIATPFYSIFVPDDLFAGEWGFDYSGYLMDWGGEYSEGLWMGHGLTVFPLEQSGEFESIGAQITSTNWDGIQGELVAISVGPVPASNQFHTVIHGPADYNSDRDGSQSRKALAPYAALVSPEIVAAQGQSGGWQIVRVGQPQPSVSENNGRTEISTPWYSVALEESLWPNGCVYHYSTETVRASDRNEGSTSCYLKLFDAKTRDLTCMVCLCDSGMTEPANIGHYYVWHNVGPSEADPAKNVFAIVPTGAPQAGNTDENFDALKEAAQPYLEQICACITLRGYEETRS